MLNEQSNEVTQRAAIGSNTTQIGVQNIYYGLSPQEACNQIIKLFYDNFPKLEAQAAELVNKRVTELMNEVAKKLEDQQIKDMAPFADPDVQYATYKAQKGYARFGTKENLKILADLIANRVKLNNAKTLLKVSIDKAIDIAPTITTSQLDGLSLLALTNQLKLDSINSIDILHNFLIVISDKFKAADLSLASTQYLVMVGAMQFQLHHTYKKLANIYKFGEAQVFNICPQLISNLNGDYLPSYSGMILGAINAESKLDFFHMDFDSFF